jgi:hypothetical protein
MRTKIAIGFALIVIVSVVLVLRSSPPSPAATLAFAGYSDDGHYAHFSLTNRTRRYLDYSHARIQLPTTTGWTNYYDMEEMLMIRDIGPLAGHQTTTLWAALPAGQHRWRAAVSYTVMPDWDSPRRMRFQPLLAFLHLEASTNKVTLTTEEFVR